MESDDGFARLLPTRIEPPLEYLAASVPVNRHDAAAPRAIEWMANEDR
jgi:hypothetical protein